MGLETRWIRLSLEIRFGPEHHLSNTELRQPIVELDRHGLGWAARVTVDKDVRDAREYGGEGIAGER